MEISSGYVLNVILKELRGGPKEFPLAPKVALRAPFRTPAALFGKCTIKSKCELSFERIEGLQ